MFDDFQRVYDRFQEAGAENPFIETLKLFNFLYKGSLQDMDLKTFKEHEIDMDKLIEKRLQGIPIEHIFGKAHFMDNYFLCNGSTLIPTPETKILVETAVQVIKERQKDEKKQKVIDMGTGCGNIAIMIAKKTGNTTVYGSDISQEAVRVAKLNAREHGMEERVKFLSGDLFDPFQNDGFDENIDVIVCNPPYMPSNSVDNLPSEIKDHEPRIALDAGPFGVDFYVRLLEDSLKYLKRGGSLVFEIGEDQEKILNRLIRKNGGFEDNRYTPYAGITRVISLFKF